MEHFYYVVENGLNTDKQALKVGHIIVKLPRKVSNLFKYGDGPYESLLDLKKNSSIYNSLKKSDLKRAQQIIEEKNIVVPVKLMFTPKDTEFENEVVDGFLHAAFGRIKNGNLTGIHFFDPQKIRIIEMIEENPVTKVFKAQFEYFDFKTEKWIQKSTPSTFFPTAWVLSTLIMECKYAFDQINNGELYDGKYHSFTESKIPIVIIMKKGKLKSLYPLI